jgi:hypothetical protein
MLPEAVIEKSFAGVVFFPQEAIHAGREGIPENDEGILLHKIQTVGRYQQSAAGYLDGIGPYLRRSLLSQKGLTQENKK